MSSISTRSNLPIDLLTRPPVDPRKQASKHTDPLRAASTTGLSQATKPGAEESQSSQARTAAEGLVSTTFIEPILKQVRESNTAPPPFGPSNAEKQFSSLLDTKLADEIVHAANFPLVERITQQLLRNMPGIDAPKETLDIKG
jgi:Rod binding domain-containing protein